MTLIRTLKTAALCCAATGAAAEAHVDMTDPNAVAVAVIEALRAQDGPALAAMLNEANQRSAEMFAAMPPGDPEWDGLWSSWRQAGIDLWDGEPLPVRYADTEHEAVMPIAYDGADGQLPLSAECGACRYIVVRLTRDGEDDETWGFEDVNGHSIGRYRNAAPAE